MKMKKFLSLLLALALMLSLVACSNASKPTESADPGAASSDTQKDAESQKDAEDQTAPEDTTAVGGLSGEIRYVSMWNETEPQAEVIKAAIEEFTTLYPDVTVNVNWMGRDITKTIVASLDAGQVDIWDQSINMVIELYSDYGYELTDLMAQENPVLDGKTYNDVANPALISAVKQYAPDGLIHGVPYQPNVVAVFYNRDMFEQAGITAAPETWEELMDVCQKLQDAGFTPFSVDDGYVVLPFGMYLGRLKGVDFVEDLVYNAAAWDDPAVKQAADAMQALWDNGYMSKNAASNKYPAGQNEVAMGDAAMYLVGSYMLNEVKEIAGDDFNWGAFAFPSPEGSELPSTANTYGMQILQVAKNAQDPELAFYFATFLTTGKYDEMMSQSCSAIPAAVDTEWPELLLPAQDVLNASTENVLYGFGINSNSDFTPIYKEQIQLLLGGQIDADTFIAACKAALGG